MTTSLIILALPPLGVSESTLKLAAILVAMSGTLFLMAGLVFLQMGFGLLDLLLSGWLYLQYLLEQSN